MKRLALEKILHMYSKFSQGKWGNWKGAIVEIELVPVANPCTARTFPVPQAYGQLVKNDKTG